jgi:hypothetical protein
MQDVAGDVERSRRQCRQRERQHLGDGLHVSFDIMRESRVASRNGGNRMRRDSRAEELDQQLGDGDSLRRAVAEHLGQDQAQTLVEHVGERAIHAAPRAVGRVKEEIGRQKTILSRQKTLDRSRPPQTRFVKRGTSLGRCAKHGSAARGQALEAAQFAPLPGRRR